MEILDDSVVRIAFKHFVAEGRPQKSPLVGLKNNNTSRILYCYLGTLNDILAVCPKLFKIQHETSAEGEDGEIYTEDIMKYGSQNYGNKKVVGSVKRFKNKVSVCIQQMFDDDMSGVYKYSPYLVQFSPEDDLEKLRSFAQEIRNEHSNFVKNSLEAAATAKTSVEAALVPEGQDVPHN